ncbi:Crp/Fnr family transcriptional regulator [Wenyingzhuangia sp. 2_MG-2023]|uniref:Crp/Fnr family transcriptional regulator n=1 Tax=Wenyingzhuangia sp. 2_MG-2023 TaxID=3062639 RepID=UPI0026E2738C|nr:Crp/Fnr family transcriptional regulator [Wenyingzhuangia sp. 2_MG-2023]MDO6738794.1 Crp/Fnr family transcriptional regulator [Wenyingzhuangia sp. 2_MG-2023]
MSRCEQCLVKQFNNLNALNKEELKDISDAKDVHVFKKGEIIFNEGKFVSGVYCIKDGVCKLSQLNANGKEQIVKFSKKGDLIGYHSAITNEANTITVTALNEVSACFIPQSLIKKPLEENPKFSTAIFKTVCSDLKEANNAITNISTNTVHQRMADLILFLKDTYGVTEDNTIKIQLSRKEIASSVGTATESAIRILSSFKKDKMIELKGKSITILDETELLKIAEGM